MQWMIDLFKARAEAVSAEVLRLATRADALAFILHLLQEEGVADAPGSRAVWAGGTFLAGVDTVALVREFPGLTFAVTRQAATEARIGISQMGWGLADTGSLVADQTAVEQRLASSLPWIHVALLPANRVLPDLPALMQELTPDQAAFIAFITGPSRTADIERVLTIGVHGPERLVICVVDEPWGAGS
jgi:L-lactate dehydrogenase complex protein LldG